MIDIDDIRVGDHLFTSGTKEPVAFGSVRAIDRRRRRVVAWIENHGEAELRPEWITAVHDEKVELDWDPLPDDLKTAIDHAHDREVT